jgi:coenzyme F420-0:L-glutamate ligase / coenzyme F420-1:gamma-L-glutamate ligase
VSTRIEIVPAAGIPEVVPGNVVGELCVAALPELAAGDVLVISQKIVSKAEDRLVELRRIVPGARAAGLAARIGKDPRLVELVLAETREIVRAAPGVLIVRTRSGLVCANAGIDGSNVGGSERVALLPENPDASARRIRAEVHAACGVRPAVVVADSFGRPWRLGQADVAIGCAGLRPLDDWRGRGDRDGRELAATEVAVADQVAAAADLARDKAAGAPAALIRGLERFVTPEDGPGAAAIQRPAASDLFRSRR